MSASSYTLQPQPSSTILFEGDSLTRFAGRPRLDTWPWMRLSGAHYGYPEKVGDWIFCNRPDLKVTCSNGAAGGSILADVLERFTTITQPAQPRIVVMTIGTNDASRGVSLGDFRDQAEKYCRRLKELCDGKVLFLGYEPFVSTTIPEAMERAAAVRTLNLAMAQVVAAQGGIAVDLSSILRRKAEDLAKLWAGHTIFHDGTHFNMVGNEMVAAVVLQALGLMTLPGDPSGLPISRASANPGSDVAR